MTNTINLELTSLEALELLRILDKVKGPSRSTIVMRDRLRALVQANVKV